MCLDFVHIAIFLLQRFTNGSIKSQNSVNSKSKLGPKKVSNLLKKHKLILSVWTPYIFNQYICTSIFLTQSLQDHPFLMFRITQNHIVWKSPKKSHSKLRAKRATFTLTLGWFSWLQISVFWLDFFSIFQSLSGADVIKKKQEKSSAVLIGIIAVFLVCHMYRIALWIYTLALPTKTLLNHYNYCHAQGKYHIPVAIYYFTQLHHLFLVINSSVNFVIYCIMGRQFRKQLKKTAVQWWRKISHWSSKKNLSGKKICIPKIVSKNVMNVLTQKIYVLVF